MQISSDHKFKKKPKSKKCDTCLHVISRVMWMWMWLYVLSLGVGKPYQNIIFIRKTQENVVCNKSSIFWIKVNHFHFTHTDKCYKYPVELKTWYARVRKYARYGKTSHRRELKTSLMWRKFSSTPKNTLILKDSLKIDRFRPKTVKTHYVRAST